MMQMPKPTYHLEYRFGDNPHWDATVWPITTTVEQATNLACFFLKKLISGYIAFVRSVHVRVIEQHGMKRLVVFRASRERD